MRKRCLYKEGAFFFPVMIDQSKRCFPILEIMYTNIEKYIDNDD